MKKVKNLLFKLLICLLVISLMSGMTINLLTVSAIPAISTNVSQGDYIVESVYNGRYFHYSEASNVLSAWKYGEHSWQQWRFVPNSDGSYSIISKYDSGAYLEVYCANYTAGQPITLYDYSGSSSSAAKFHLRQNSNGSYCISPKSMPSLVLELYIGSNTVYEHNGRFFEVISEQSVRLAPYTGASNQCWNIQPQTPYTYYTGLASGVYYIENMFNNQYLYYYATDNLAETRAYNGRYNERWEITNHGNGIYTFQTEGKTNYCMEVHYGINKTGQPIKVISYSQNMDSAYIKMRLIRNTDGTFKICPVVSPTRAIGVYTGTTASYNYDGRTFYKENGKFVDLQNNIQSTTQNWKFTRILPLSGSELDFNPSKWDGEVENNNNCYAYAINNQVKDNGELWYLQNPGMYSGDGVDLGDYSLPADNFILAVKNDFKVYSENTGSTYVFEEIDKYAVCDEGTYKVALFFDRNLDYHWYRQDSDGFWSHKHSTNPISRYQTNSQILITEPDQIERGLYETFVGYYQVTPWNRYYQSNT